MKSPAIRRALVFGATGFLGSHLIAHLEDLGVEALGLAGSVSFEPDGSGETGGGSSDLAVDVGDLRSVFAVMRDLAPSHVFHLAATRNRGVGATDLADSVRVNVVGTANVAAAASELGVDRLVITGTADEYGSIAVPFREADTEHPQTAYGISKMLATRAALACGEMTGLEVTALRISVAYGPGQAEDSLLGGLVAAVASGRRFAMSAGGQTRDFIWAGDVAEGLVRAALAPGAAGEIVNLGSGVAMRVADAAMTAAGSIGREDLVGIGETSPRPGEAAEYELDLAKAETLLGWLPATSFDDGVAQMMAAAGL